MSISPLAQADSLRIGTIDFVSPDEIKVLLDIEAPGGVALNTGTPRAFPRINGYVLIPSDEGYLVAQVEWITIERSPYPKRRGMQDFGLVDLPFPLRKMSLNPLGRLHYDDVDSFGNQKYRFQRGVESYPTVGDPVLLPTQIQLRAIVESGDNRHVHIGNSPLAANAKVMIDPDRLFGRHLAVLGNTGSGKSCSVAGLVRWSLEAAGKELPEGETPNARFIILDPNGEYANTFKDMSKVKVFAVEPKDEEIQQLQVPLWFWNSAEWSAFTQASSKTQRPTLVQALRSVKEGVFSTNISHGRAMRQYLRTLISTLKLERNAGSPWGKFPHNKNFFEKIKKWYDGLNEHESFTIVEKDALISVRELLHTLIDTRSVEYPTYDFTRTEIEDLLSKFQRAHSTFGGSLIEATPLDADTPRNFTGEQLLQSIEATSELLGVSDYIDTMLMRIRTILADSKLKPITSNDNNINLESWLNDYLGSNNASNGSITVIDLSLVPAEVVHILTSVIARMTLESLQRYRKLNHGKTLPTVLVMEEAHTFIKRYPDNAETQSSASICCQVFEKIAREGRKFGLGLVLSSQRPSELSPTVLSQCNSYLLHRISNDRDQELVHKLVPDNLKGLLRDLPSLPSRHAVLLGWASELPVFVQMKDLPSEHRPKSDDPDFWNVWSGKDAEGNKVERNVDWKSIADDWQQISPTLEDTEIDLENEDE